MLTPLLVSKSEYEFRYIQTRMWLKIIGFLMPVAFFFGLQLGNTTTAARYMALTKQLPHACYVEYRALVDIGLR